jgi:hypothetical protein
MTEQNAVDVEVVDPNAEQNVEVNSDNETIEVTSEEIIDAFQSVFEELVILRNSVVNLHERLEKLEQPSNVSL